MTNPFEWAWCHISDFIRPFISEQAAWFMVLCQGMLILGASQWALWASPWPVPAQLVAGCIGGAFGGWLVGIAFAERRP